jgi:hypothetical protein
MYYITLTIIASWQAFSRVIRSWAWKKFMTGWYCCTIPAPLLSLHPIAIASITVRN